MDQKVREHTFTWADPLVVARNLVGRPHLEWMADMIAGRIPPPPMASAMGFAFLEAQPGHVRFSVDPAEWTANPAGVVHGGFTTTLLDTVMTLVVVTKLPPGLTATTLDLQMHFVRPAFPESTLFAQAAAVHVGSTVGTAEGRITDQTGRLIAHGTATLAIITPRPPGGASESATKFPGLP
jgi:uncharacterized protein (TIGR00369 family)